MSYSWTENANAEGGNYAEPLPEGEHEVTISRIIYGSRDSAFVSKSGDPQIMLVFSDDQAREAAQMVTLSDKAGWVLARIMGACNPPVNLQRMEQDGIEPSHFADEQFADGQLLNRQLRILVEYEQRGEKQYANVTPVKSTSAPAPEGPPQTDAPPATDAPPPTSGMTKDEAWATVVNAWAGNADPDATKRRNDAWVKAFKDIGKAENDFMPADWAKVAESASLPF